MSAAISSPRMPVKFGCVVLKRQHNRPTWYPGVNAMPCLCQYTSELFSKDYILPGCMLSGNRDSVLCGGVTRASFFTTRLMYKENIIEKHEVYY